MPVQRPTAAAPQLLMPWHRDSVRAALRCTTAGVIAPTMPPARQLAGNETAVGSRRPRAPERPAMEATRPTPRETSACHLNAFLGSAGLLLWYGGRTELMAVALGGDASLALLLPTGVLGAHTRVS